MIQADTPVLSPKDAADKLARLMERELGFETVSDDSLRAFIQNHWDIVSLCAHCIHGDDRMPDEPMTLIERLRNPQWRCSGHVSDNYEAVMDPVQTRRDMDEAADELERAKLRTRSVAFRVKASNGDWILYEDEEEAYRFSESTGAQIQGLYVRDGT